MEEEEYIEELETAPDLDPEVESDEEYYYYDPVPELLPELEEFLGDQEELVVLSDPIPSEVDLTETNTLLCGVIIGLGFLFGALLIKTLLEQVK